MANSHADNSRLLDPLVMAALTTGDAAAVAEHKEWLRAAGRSHNTINSRVRLLLRLDAWLRVQPVPRTLGTATADDLANWQRSISKMALETIGTYVGHARGYYRWLAKYKHAADASVLLVNPSRPRRLPRPVEDDDLRAAIRMADGPILISLLMMAFCGMRVGEVAILQRHDIRDHEDPPVVVVHGKGRKMRIVPMPHDLAPALRRIGVPVRGYVVLSPSGQPYTPARLSQIVNDYLHGHGITSTAHSCRHWYGTKAYRSSKDLRLVQELVGHSNPATTAGYAAYDPHEARQVVIAMDGVLNEMMTPARRRLRAVD